VGAVAQVKALCGMTATEVQSIGSSNHSHCLQCFRRAHIPGLAGKHRGNVLLEWKFSSEIQCAGVRSDFQWPRELYCVAIHGERIVTLRKYTSAANAACFNLIAMGNDPETSSGRQSAGETTAQLQLRRSGQLSLARWML
jgi:hypothetical protein